jgi:dihydroorotase
MPNIAHPVTTVQAAEKYFEEIEAAIPADVNFTPLMTLYFTEHLTPAEVKKARESGIVQGIKLYPKGATTNSDSGISHLQDFYPILEAMEKYEMPLLIHGEVVDANVDIFDREAIFIDKIFMNILKYFPNLRVVLEHITSKYAADFIAETPETIAATITAHHLHINRNDILAGGIKPHHYCLPIAKRETDRQALIKLATSGSKKVFAGTDTAPHPQAKKESACGCAGIFTAHAAVELYAEAFDHAGKLENLEAFLSKNGADFYGLPYNQGIITLTKVHHKIPEFFETSEGEKIIPFRAGGQTEWRIS